MKKEVLITIVGLHNSDSDSDKIDTICDGTYGKLGETHVVTYEETDEDGVVYKTTLRLRDGYLEVTKKGTITSKLVYEKDRKTVTEYNTPYGAISLEFDTKIFEVSESEDELIAHVEYSMGICGAHHADCCIDINIKNRE